MKGSLLEVRVSRSPELKARGIEHATYLLSVGDRAGAEVTYQAAANSDLQHPASWSNLAALGVALDDVDGASQHARRALQLDVKSSDAWVNFGVASWHAGRRRDAAQAMHRALAINPGLEAAALNSSRMFQSLPDYARAAGVLAAALQHNPGSWRLHQMNAEMERLQMQHSRARSSILQALRLKLKTLDPGQPGATGLRPPSGKDVSSALRAVCERLEALGVPYHLMAGTLLAIVKDGELFKHDKDLELGLLDLDDASGERVRASFDADADFRVFRGPPAETGPARAIAVVHKATGVGISLMLPIRQADGGIRTESGWPDQLASVLRPYEVGLLKWEGREWPVPVPIDQHLEDTYGPDWREQVCTEAGVAYDRCYSDTMVCNASRTIESSPRAITMGLIRLMHILNARQWSKAVAYCAQLIHREPLPEVRALLVQLQAAGHEGLRFEG